jgi:hypothetical protein
MSQSEFNQMLNSLGNLSPDQLAALRRELDNMLARSLTTAKQGITSPLRKPEKPGKPGRPAVATVFDVLDQTGLIGCIKGKPGSPTDLATNPDHMEGFGHG